MNLTKRSLSTIPKKRSLKDRLDLASPGTPFHFNDYGGVTTETSKVTSSKPSVFIGALNYKLLCCSKCFDQCACKLYSSKGT